MLRGYYEGTTSEDRVALVIESPPNLGCAKIMYTDTGEIKSVLKSNLKLVSRV